MVFQQRRFWLHSGISNASCRHHWGGRQSCRGVLAGLASGLPLADAVLLGNAVASWVVGHRGGDCAPTREELLLAHKNV